MKEYHNMKQKEIKKTVVMLNEFKEKFPLLDMKNINLAELAKSLNLKEKDFKSMIVFSDMINKNKSFVTVDDVYEIKIKRNKNHWKFKIISTLKKETDYLEHFYDI